MQQVLPLRSTGGNEHTPFIKLLAILFMIVDHVGVVFFPRLRILRYIGRIAFPLFCWGIVVGACKSRNLYRYALRLLLVGMISQPFYMLALNHTIREMNVFCTLLFGLIGIIGIREKRYYSHIWVPALVIILSHYIKMDYGTRGVVLILLMYLGRKRPFTIALALLSMCLCWWQGKAFWMWFRMQISDFSTLPKVYVEKIQPFAFLSLPILLLPMNTSFRLPKWLGYSAYPLHLLVIYLLDRFV